LAKFTMSRGSAIATMLGTAAACALTRRSDAGDEGLAAAAARWQRFFGSAVRIGDLKTEPNFAAAVIRECAMLVPEFEMNWNEIEPAYGELSFAKMDALSAFAIAQGKKMRGHTLLWHLGVPEWALDVLRENQDWNLIARYFGSVIPRYGDVIGTWEVVNEPIDPGQRSDGLRESIFVEAFGPDYIGRALTAARNFAPKAQLIINEYGLEYDLPAEAARRYYLLKLLERLKGGGIPLDGLGVQAHLDLRKGSISQSAVADFLREVADMGLSIVVTELDVKEADYAATAVERDRMVADEVRRYLDVALSERAVTGVTTWGLSDLHSWLEITKDDYARFSGAWADGTRPGFNRGLPLDSSMRAKPMYFAIRDALWYVKPRAQKRRKKVAPP
jgi:endo-1,4-beta-xylanase